MPLLRGLHEGRAAAQLDVGPGLDEEVGHLEEPAAARQGQGRLLRLFRLAVNVRICGTMEGRKEMFYLTMHSTHFIYDYMASDIW